jgi:hypothetical protein
MAPWVLAGFSRYATLGNICCKPVWDGILVDLRRHLPDRHMDPWRHLPDECWGSIKPAHLKNVPVRPQKFCRKITLISRYLSVDQLNTGLSIAHT